MKRTAAAEEIMEGIIARDAPRTAEEEAAVAMVMVLIMAVATTTAMILATRMHVDDAHSQSGSTHTTSQGRIRAGLLPTVVQILAVSRAQGTRARFLARRKSPAFSTFGMCRPRVDSNGRTMEGTVCAVCDSMDARRLDLWLGLLTVGLKYTLPWARCPQGKDWEP